MLATIPLGRRGTDLDIANAVKFLASDAASYIPSHVLDVKAECSWVIRLHSA